MVLPFVLLAALCAAFVTVALVVRRLRTAREALVRSVQVLDETARAGQALRELRVPRVVPDPQGPDVRGRTGASGAQH